MIEDDEDYADDKNDASVDDDDSENDDFNPLIDEQWLHDSGSRGTLRDLQQAEDRQGAQEFNKGEIDR